MHVEATIEPVVLSSHNHIQTEEEVVCEDQPLDFVGMCSIAT